MGQCAGKSVCQGKKEKDVFKNIPPNSPLGEMLDNWDSDDIVKGLDKIRMIKYCIEVWPRESISEGPVYWPWY